MVRVQEEYKKGKTDAQGMRVVIVRSGEAAENTEASETRQVPKVRGKSVKDMDYWDKEMRMQRPAMEAHLKVVCIGGA